MSSKKSSAGIEDLRKIENWGSYREDSVGNDPKRRIDQDLSGAKALVLSNGNDLIHIVSQSKLAESQVRVDRSGKADLIVIGLIKR